MENKSNEEALQIYDKLYTYLKQHEIRVSLNVIDDKTSLVVKQQIEETGVSFQLVEPHNHCADAS